MFSKFLITALALITFSSLASWEEANQQYSKRRVGTKEMRKIIIELVQDEYLFTALPWMKEYLSKGSRRLDRRLDSALSIIINTTGTKQFETLPIRFLRRSNSDSMGYVLAKKYAKESRYSEALEELRQISSVHPISPFASNLEATIHATRGDNQKAIAIFERCIDSSKKKINQNPNNLKYKINRDYCIAGRARASFGAKKYDQSDLQYLDLPKSSRVWPEILFEEAWNSYYQKNYNRTLGKLVSYKAPVFSYMFNPEIEVLSALSYLKLCLYNDAKTVSDDFYTNYLSPARRLRLYLNKHKRKTVHFYDVMSQFERSGSSYSDLLSRMLTSINRDEAFLDMKRQMILAAQEYARVNDNPRTRFKKSAILNIREYIKTQKQIIGAYVKSRLISHYASLYKAFEGMSYIKLEVLAQKKAKLYSFEKKNDRERGDIKYIERNEKQYFWDFNGEFWADELGDYVFALRSEC